MTRGASTVAPRLCKMDGCGRPSLGRGMCAAHWKTWARKNPDTRIYKTTMKLIEDLLPGHQAQLVSASGMCEEAVKNNLAWLKEEGRAHIGYYDPPTKKGTRWKAVWVQGEGVDAKLTAKMKYEHMRAGERQAYARRQSSKLGWAAPIARAA